MTTNDKRMITSLRELPTDVPPPRDLWQGIEARLAAEPQRSAARTEEEGTRSSQANLGGLSGRWRSNRMQLVAAAAMVATLAVGVWIGRSVLPSPSGTGVASTFSGGTGTTAPLGTGTSAALGEPEALPAAYVMGARYTHERAALVKSLEAQLATLPPESRAKVMTSLATIHDSIQNLEAALGHDPTNALLQELLVNTYQDEMRVLTAVHEAGDSGKGI